VKRLLALPVSAVLLAGCVASVDPYSKADLAETHAIVLVGVDSSISFSEASGRCPPHHCAGPFQLGGRHEVMAYPVKVGGAFQIETIRDLLNRSAAVSGPVLKIPKRGIYYYGTILSSSLSARLVPVPYSRMLHAAKRKFGARFDGLEVVNFSWPDSATDDLGFSYRESSGAQEALKAHRGKPLNIAAVAARPTFDARCRLGGRLSLPDFYPYEEYVRRALNHELAAAGAHGEGPDAVALKGRLTELSFSTAGEKPFWKIGLELSAPDGRMAQARTTTHFEPAWDAADICPRAEDALMGAVQQLLEALVTSQAFEGLVAAPSPIH
jgi:hypothetical protein